MLLTLITLNQKHSDPSVTSLFQHFLSFTQSIIFKIFSLTAYPKTMPHWRTKTIILTIDNIPNYLNSNHNSNKTTSHHISSNFIQNKSRIFPFAIKRIEKFALYFKMFYFCIDYDKTKRNSTNKKKHIKFTL
jgi:hypothetical protein